MPQMRPPSEPAGPPERVFGGWLRDRGRIQLTGAAIVVDACWTRPSYYTCRTLGPRPAGACDTGLDPGSLAVEDQVLAALAEALLPVSTSQILQMTGLQGRRDTVCRILARLEQRGIVLRCAFPGQRRWYWARVSIGRAFPEVYP
jgi:hypothetical protein